MAPFERLEAWQLCHSLVVQVYRLTEGWPSQERFGLVSQVRRAAVSITTNIAEGSAKRGGREFRRFLDISLGSLAELTYLLRLAKDLGYLAPDAHAELEAMRDRAGVVTWRLYQAITAAPK
ncbi:MAG: four helix bundle protein [Gemmatimonadetes bacterium]|nr:four helix bundle protein [Gemmatimonadota bacterium]